MSQESVNKQILAQLSALGDRLATLDYSTAKCKKLKIKSKKGCRQWQYHTGGCISASQGQASLASLNPVQDLVPLSGLNSIVPPPSVLRQEAHIQQEVQQRLQDLAKNC